MKKLNTISSQKLSHLSSLVSNHSKKVDASKTDYKKLPKSKKRELQKRRDLFPISSTKDLFLDIQTIIELQNFLLNLLSIVLDYPSLKVSFSAPDNTKKFIEYILQDRSFKNHIIYSLMNEKPKNIIGSNIISLLFLYIFKDKKMTIVKIKDFLSMYIVKSGVNFEVASSLTSKQKIVLNQLKTGVKEEKLKNQNPLNNSGYRKSSKHFSIIDTTNNFVRIKYISTLNGKHKFHKSPIVHFRRETIRYYKSGKVVHVKSSIVNRGSA